MQIKDLPSTSTVNSTDVLAKETSGGTTNKVAISDFVINNLTSTSTTQPLAAAQGKVLNSKIQYLNIGSSDMLSAIVNALSDGQMCYFRTTSTTTNQPSTGMYMIGHAIRGGTNNITIQASEMSVPSVVHQNSTTDGGSTWNGWSRIYTVPKTVPTTDDLDNYRGANYSGTYNLNGQVTNAPSAYGALLVIGNYQVCIAKNNLYFRGYSGNPASWGSWHNVSFT